MPLLLIPTPRSIQKKDILIENGSILKISTNITPPKNTKVVGEKNLHVCPGLFDLTVHFGEPGFEHKETLDSGCSSHVRWIHWSRIIPETNPALDNKSAIEFCINSSREHLVDVFPYGTVSKSKKEKNSAKCMI